MHRRFEGGPLVIASHNPVKVREIADLLAPHGAQAVAARDLGLAEPLEAGDTFRANAETKARARRPSRRPAGPGRRFGLVGRRDWRGAGHPFGALGGTGQELRPRHAKTRGRTRRHCRPPRPLRLRPRALLAGRPLRDLRGVRLRESCLATAGRHGIRLRSGLRTGGRRRHLRRDGRGTKARHQPPGRRRPAASHSLFRGLDIAMPEALIVDLLGTLERTVADQSLRLTHL